MDRPPESAPSESGSTRTTSAPSVPEEEHGQAAAASPVHPGAEQPPYGSRQLYPPRQLQQQRIPFAQQFWPSPSSAPSPLAPSGEHLPASSMALPAPFLPVQRQQAPRYRPPLLFRGVNVDPIFLDVLGVAKDRIVLLQLEQECNRLVKDPTSEKRLELSPMSSYHRLIAHRLADLFRLAHVVVENAQGQRVVVLFKNEYSCPPPFRFGELEEALLGRQAPEEDCPGEPGEERAAAMIAGAAASNGEHEDGDEGQKGEEANGTEEGNELPLVDKPSTRIGGTVRIMQRMSTPTPTPTPAALRNSGSNGRTPASSIGRSVSSDTSSAARAQQVVAASTALPASGEDVMRQREAEYEALRARIFEADAPATLPVGAAQGESASDGKQRSDVEENGQEDDFDMRRLRRQKENRQKTLDLLRNLNITPDTLAGAPTLEAQPGSSTTGVAGQGGGGGGGGGSGYVGGAAGMMPPDDYHLYNRRAFGRQPHPPAPGAMPMYMHPHAMHFGMMSLAEQQAVPVTAVPAHAGSLPVFYGYAYEQQAYGYGPHVPPPHAYYPYAGTVPPYMPPHGPHGQPSPSGYAQPAMSYRGYPPHAFPRFQPAPHSGMAPAFPAAPVQQHTGVGSDEEAASDDAERLQDEQE